MYNFLPKLPTGGPGRILPLLLLLLGCVTTAQAQQLANRDYADLLTKSIKFFEAQACGPDAGSHSSNFSWRGDCHENDGSVVGKDYSGGWHDAGDHVKFNYPMASVVYTLASLYVDHRAEVNNTGNRALLLKQLRYVGDYLIKCHDSPNSFVIQVAQGVEDHRYWERPEVNSYRRDVYRINTNKPGTDLACSIAASMAVLASAFDGVDNNYRDELIQHARDLYAFGDNYRGWYSDHIPAAERAFYQSNKGKGYAPSLAIGAISLYRATGEQQYLTKAENAASSITWIGGWAPGWGNDDFEAIYQLAKVTGKAQYKNVLKRYCVALADGSEGQRSPGGMYYPDGRGYAGFSLPLSLGTAFMCYRYAELVGPNDPDYNRTRNYAFGQVNYALGSNPNGKSYVLGFGNNHARRAHHRSAHGPNGGQIDGDPTNDTHLLLGALLMGPRGADDYFNNTRSEHEFTEPALGNNATLALVAAQMVQETGSTPPPPVYENKLSNLSAPNSFNPGGNYRATINYESDGNHDVVAVLQYDGDPNWAWIAPEVRKQVSAGTGSLTFDLKPRANTPIRNDAYQVNIFIAARGGNYSTRKATQRKNNLDCVSAAPPATTNTWVYRDNFTSGWANWSWGGNVTVRDSGIKKRGTHAFKYYTNGGGAASMRHNNGKDATNLNSVKFWARSWDTNFTGKFQARWNDSSGGGRTNFNVTPAWKAYSIPKSSLGTDWIKRMVWQVPAGNTLWLDDVRLVYNTSSNRGTVEQSVSAGAEGFATEDVGLSLYPNPNSGVFNVTVTTPADRAGVDLQVIDLTGRTVETSRIDLFAGTNQLRVDLRERNLPQGIYLFRVIAADGTLNLVRKVSIR
ncbi:glycoside hydrolase family 9 protein [Lewinella sp. 4G2]|uniref:glycoside hydrolase family 9 protein n=1 Tax=Lewinella sp. 4G2 TaxID=1803372 RepID=UPI0007B4C5DB|nr:glycoside hydrolase family 9 protein [Lewinella sp. 4G2]OAV43110.1 hypothetical protein A3850_000745 [Lewinella sp. 4G2]